jgi:hypothetical protein
MCFVICKKNCETDIPQYTQGYPCQNTSEIRPRKTIHHPSTGVFYVRQYIFQETRFEVRKSTAV